MIDPYFSRKNKALGPSLLVSILFHLLIVLLAILYDLYLRDRLVDEVKRALEVRSITLEELRKELPKSMVVDSAEPTLSQSAPLSDEAKKEAKTKFLSTKTQRVKEETRARNFGALKDTSKPNKSKNILVDPKILGKEVTKGDQSILEKGGFDFLDPTMKISAQTLLNTDEYVFSSFFLRMREPIVQRWHPLANEVIENKNLDIKPGLYKTKVKVFVSRAGKVLDVALEQSSGIKQLDNAAIISIFQARQFNNPPIQLFEEDPRGGLNFTFYVYVYESNRIRFVEEPDERLQK